jgi:O-antigen ligase
MGLKDLIAILIICSIFFGSKFLPGPREWWQSVVKNPLSSFLILGAILSVFLGQPRGAQAIVESPVDPIRLARILLLTVLAVVSAIGIILNLSKKISSGPGVKWMAAYSIFAMASAFYSFLPLLTLWKGFEVLSAVCVGGYIGIKLKDEVHIQDAMNTILLALWFLVISSLVGAVMSPAEAFAEMKAKGAMAFALNGVYPFVNANTLSQIAGMLAACALAWMVKPKRDYGVAGPLVVFLLSMLSLLLSHSRTSIVALFLVVLVLFIVFRKTFMVLGVSWLGILLAISGTIMQYLMPYFERGQSAKVFATLSGRTTFWPEVIKKIGDEPFAGYGFYASQRIMWGISSVDNTYLETILGVGIIGVTLLCIPLLTIMFNLWRTRPWKMGLDLKSQGRFIWIQLFALFSFLFIRSLTGPSFQNLHINLVIFIILLVSSFRLHKILASNRKEKIKDGPTP